MIVSVDSVEKTADIERNYRQGHSKKFAYTFLSKSMC